MVKKSFNAMKWFEVHGISTSWVNKHNLKIWTKNSLNTSDGGV